MCPLSSVRISSSRINPSRWIILGTDAVRERRNRVELPINRVGISAGVGFHQHERPSSSTPRLTEASAFGVLANRIIRIREVSRMTRHNVNASTEISVAQGFSNPLTPPRETVCIRHSLLEFVLISSSRSSSIQFSFLLSRWK